MRRMARGVRSFRIGLPRLLALAAASAVFATLLLVPATGGASGIASRLGHAMRNLADTSETGQAFDGVAAVGALFTESSGKLSGHFCTASVVNSTHGDLAITAAHCVTGRSAPIVFIPGYANGEEPYGIWTVIRVYTDQNWQSSQNPDDDVAFIQLADASDGVPIEDVTGAEQLGTGRSAHALVQVIGYPDGKSQPVWCMNWTKNFSSSQLEFDCAGYTDGTSGSPFLADVSASSGQGTVVGVIGGYEKGGDTSSVSYSIAFGTNVAGLYQAAEAGG
jgi:V8-like Glu-specific endopeptidase